MQQLFYECEEVGTFEHAWINRYGDVERDTIAVYATCTAHWDQKRSVLVIDLIGSISRELSEEWMPAAKRIFETQGIQAGALRSTIAHADAWTQLIREKMPVGDAHRTDDQIKAREPVDISFW